MSKEFKYVTKIYYEDTDAGGVVYYANYLKFLERARSEAIYSLGLSNKEILEKEGVIIIVKTNMMRRIRIRITITIRVE